MNNHDGGHPKITIGVILNSILLLVLAYGLLWLLKLVI